jgi:hypothetical protein
LFILVFFSGAILFGCTLVSAKVLGLVERPDVGGCFIELFEVFESLLCGNISLAYSVPVVLDFVRGKYI